jgi:hypothetical protein
MVKPIRINDVQRDLLKIAVDWHSCVAFGFDAQSGAATDAAPRFATKALPKPGSVLLREGKLRLGVSVGMFFDDGYCMLDPVRISRPRGGTPGRWANASRGCFQYGRI